MKVIVFNIHGARLDALGAYGGNLAATPHFDEFAARSTVFDQHYAEHLPGLSEDSRDPGVELQEDLLELLTARLITDGGSCALFADQRVMDAPGFAANWKQSSIVMEQDLSILSQPTLSDAVLQQSIDWLQDYGQAYSRWLLQIELGALLPDWREEEYHPPRATDEPAEETQEPNYHWKAEAETPAPERFGWRAAYGGVVRYLDDLFGQFLKLLQELELMDECTILVQSPWGQPLGEYGPTPNRPQGIFEERVHLPLLIKFPRGAGAGKRVHHFTQPRDVLSTQFQLLTGTPCETLQADNLYRYTQAQAGRFREYAISTLYADDSLLEASIRAKHWSLTVPFSSLLDKPIQLYRKPEDRWDMNNVAKEHLDVAEHLELTLHRYLHWLQQGSCGEIPSLRNEVVQVLAQ